MVGARNKVFTVQIDPLHVPFFHGAYHPALCIEDVQADAVMHTVQANGGAFIEGVRVDPHHTFRWIVAYSNA